MSGPLYGVRVLVTRPATQAVGLCRMIEAAGGEAARLPLLVVEPAGDADALRTQLAASCDASGWIATSRNAAERALQLHDGPWPPLFAVGPATAEALTAAGRGPVTVPERDYSSDGLLALPQLAEVAGQRWVILCGEEPRPLLADTLSRRGAQVDPVLLYRRRPLSYDPARVEAEVGMADALVVTSGEALQHLLDITPASLLPTLLQRPLAVPSQRLQEQARTAGFTTLLQPTDATDEAVLASLVDWHASAGAAALPSTPTTAADGKAPQPGTPAPAPANPSAATSGAASGSAGSLGWLVAAGLLIGLIGGGLWVWQMVRQEREARSAQALAIAELTRQSAELQAQLSQVGGRLGDVSRSGQRNALDLATLTQRMDESAQLLGAIGEELQGGRSRFQMASVEHLLVAANDRLLLEHDLTGALIALEVADARLARINEPRLFIVRQALADERAALRALPRPDTTGAALRLDALIASVEHLPLRVQPPRGPGHDADSNADAPPEQTGWAAARSTLRQLMDRLFTIRRVDDPLTHRLLPLEQQETLRQVLTLRLDSARIALLRGDSAHLSAAAIAARDWLRAHFDVSDPAVSAALSDLDQLQGLTLDLPQPDISRSLVLLRAQLEASAP